jgi:hypothetical protein
MEISCSMLAGASPIALGCTSALAQQVTAVPGSPEATTVTGTSAARSEIRRGDQGESLGLEGLDGAARAARMLADLI